jgi:hypothetical protein
MATIKLGQRPKTFKPIVVTFPMPEGGDGTIEITYQYRTRSEFGELIDALYKEAGQTPRAEGEEFSMKDLMEKTRDKNADYLHKCIAAWNLDVDLSLESLRQLADELPAAASAIMDKYRSAALEGRLGN